MKEHMKRLERENEVLRARLEVAEENLRAIKNGEVDALVLAGPGGQQVFTLKDANHPYRLIVEEMEEGAITVADNGTILYSNRQFAAMVKTSLEKLIGSSVYDYLDASNSSIVESILNSHPGRTKKTEVSFGRSGKRRRHAYVSFRPLEIEGKSLLSGVVTDITQLRRGEEDRLRLVAAIEQAVDSVIILDLKGTIQYANPACARITGYKLQEIVGNSLDLFGRYKGQGLTKTIRTSLKREDVWKGHITGRKKDSNNYDMEVTASGIRDNKDQLINYIVIGHDVTYELKLQEQLRHMQRLEAVGRLAGGIAHDLNNILSPIIVNTELLLDEAESRSGLYEGLEAILRAAYRQRDLVKQILIFSRQSEQKQALIHVNPVIEEAIRFLRASLPSTIEIRKDIAGPPDTILGDPTQIHQIVMNLFSNAADAIKPGSGVIEIRVDNVRLKTNEHAELKPGEYLKLTVTDSGRGMGPSTLERIFDPFFTTKKQGEGTGMGLAVVHGIIKKHRGAATVNSEPGKGTRFEIWFPLVEASVHSEEVSAQDLVENSGQRILLIDDEKLVVRSLNRALNRHGYRVTPATDGVEALEIFRRNPQHFDLVIADNTMPGMTGIQLAQELLNIRQDIPIIISTGYSNNLSEEELQSLRIREVLMKPAGMKELIEAVQRALT